MFRPGDVSGHSTDSEDDHDDLPLKRAKRQQPQLGPSSELNKLATYTFTTPPNLLEYRAAAFAQEKRKVIKDMKSIALGESEEYNVLWKQIEEETKEIKTMLDRSALAFAENIGEDFELDLARAKREHRTALEACEKEFETELQGALREVEKGLNDLKSDDAMENIVRPDLTGVQPGITKRNLRSRNGKKITKPKTTKRRARREYRHRQEHLFLPQEVVNEDLAMLTANMLEQQDRPKRKAAKA